MTNRFNSRIQTTLLISSMLMVSACASFKSGETVANKADVASNVTLGKGKFETPPQIPQTNAAKVNETIKTAVETPPVTTPPSNPNNTRINSREPYVNTRTAPSARSRVVAVLKQGQEVEVLEKKHGWLKLKWQHGQSEKTGWMNKSFVEGFEQ